MTNTLNKLEYRNPEIENDVNDALQRNIDAGLGKAGLGDVLGQQVADARKKGGLEELEAEKTEIEKTREKYAGRNIAQEIKDLDIGGSLSNEEKREKIAKALDCRLDQVSFTEEEALSGKDIVYDYGDLDLNNIESTEDLILPLSVGGSLNLDGLKSAENLVLPQSVGGFLSLDGLELADNLILQLSVGDSIWLDGLKSAENLVIPQSIIGDIHLDGLESAKNLILPQSINGDLTLDGLKSAEDLVLPKSVGGGIMLDSLISAENLVLSQSIGGNIWLQRLKSIRELDLSNVDVIGVIYLSEDICDRYKDELEMKYPNLVGKFKTV